MKKPFKQGCRDSDLQQTLFGLEPVPETKRCAECHKAFTPTGIIYTLVRKGQKEARDYCQPCAKAILRPQEATAEI